MSDSTPNGTYTLHPPSSPQSFFSISHLTNINSIPHYTNTSENDFEPRRRSQTIDYGNVDGYGSGNEPREVYPAMASGVTGGRWNSGLRSMYWATEPLSWSRQSKFDYAMTGMEEQEEHYEASGGFEASGDQKFEEQSEFEATRTMGTAPYSFTYLDNSSARSSTLRISELEPLSSPYQQIDINDARSRDQPQRGVTYSESNYTPSTCPREGCRGTYRYPTFQSYRTHVKNVHEKDIFCHVLECNRSRTRPFNTETDRRRHHTVRHDPNASKTFRCERAVCRARVKAFHRKDKLSAHDKKYHTQIMCHICSQYFHGSDELFRHTNFGHGPISNSEMYERASRGH
jgi:hypothetical protein